MAVGYIRIYSAVLKESKSPLFLRFCLLPSPVHSDVIAVGHGKLQITFSWGKQRPQQVWSATCINCQSHTELNGLIVYTSWRCGTASLVTPGGATCLHVRAQSCDYWFFCREAGSINVTTIELFWFCMSYVSASKKSHQEAYNPSFRFTVNFLGTSPIPHNPISFEATLPLRAEGAPCLPRDGCTFQGHPWFLAVPQSRSPPSLKCHSFAAEMAVPII